MEVKLSEALVLALQDAGADVVLVPPTTQPDPAFLSVFAGVVLAGGAFDIHPRHYGQAVAARLDTPDDDRTATELALARLCLEAGVPVLGICGGLQAMAVAAGGTLHQHIPHAYPHGLDHEQPTDPATPAHAVHLSPGRLADWLGARVQVNSTHHQSVADPGTLRVVGRSPDGVVEAIEGPGPCCVGVQWHPELLGADHAPLFSGFVEAADRRPRGGPSVVSPRPA